MESERVLEVKNLKTHFFTGEGVAKAVDGISFELNKGETLGIVGESGCGKSMTSLSILGLVPNPPGKIVDGEINLYGENLVSMSERALREIRGKKISMIFQEPMTSLNPVLTVGEQIAETLRLHEKLSRKAAWKKAIEMLKVVGIPSPEKRAKQEPYQLSGGMRQRVMIAMAIACNPDVLIADEPTTALDVTIQAQILEILKELQQRMGMSIIFITHDLGVVAEVCTKVAVMYAGQIVEQGETKTLFKTPLHPYTRGLIDSLPKLYEEQEELKTIEGAVPSPYHYPEGCRYAERCAFSQDICKLQAPELVNYSDGRKVRCHIYTEAWSKNVEKEKVYAED